MSRQKRETMAITASFKGKGQKGRLREKYMKHLIKRNRESEVQSSDSGFIEFGTTSYMLRSTPLQPSKSEKAARVERPGTTENGGAWSSTP